MTKSLAMTQKLLGRAEGSLVRGARVADPRRMTPAEHGEAHALLVRVVTDPADWQAASQALDELMGRLPAVRRLLAEERLPKREPRAHPM